MDPSGDLGRPKECFVDAVLGLSVTPSAVGLVLVQGQDGEGATAGFEVDARGSWSALETSEQAAAAVLRTEALAAGRGHRVHSIGVTWSDEADKEASLLLKSLSDSGFDNIVPVRLSEATDALARGIAQVAGYRTTAVCVIEPEQLIALVVQTAEGAVQTAVNHTIVTEDDLVGWLSAVFTKADWQPEALVLVGSVENLDGLLPALEEALSVPVFTPAEAQLALARGAALACAQNGDFRFYGGAGGATADSEPPAAVGRRVRRLAQVGPAAVLAAGVVTFVASASAALALQSAPERSVPQARPAAEASAQTPVAVRGTAPAPLRPATPVLEAAPLPAPEVARVPAPVYEPVPDAEQISQEATIREAPIMEATLPQPELAADLPPLGATPPGLPPPGLPAPEALPPAVPQQPQGFMQRIRERISGIGDEQQQPAAVPPPPGAQPLPPQ